MPCAYGIIAPELQHPFRTGNVRRCKHALDPVEEPAKAGAMALVYKIVPKMLWRSAVEAGIFAGALIDIADGFIHFSTAAQARETAARHFAGQRDLLLVCLDGVAFGEALTYEKSRGGDLFPHLYGTFKPSQALWAKPLPLGPDGEHIFPVDMA